MKFKGIIFLVALLFVISPKQSYAVADIGVKVCSTADKILALVPDDVGFLDKWRIRCSWKKGCWKEYKCHSKELGKQVKALVSQVCDMVTQTAAGIDQLPKSALTFLNKDLGMLYLQIQDFNSLSDPSAVTYIDEAEVKKKFDAIETSLDNIENAMPKDPGTKSKWVKKKSHCKKAEGGLADTATTSKGAVTTSTQSKVDLYEAEAKAESDSQLTAEILSTCGKEPDWVPDYRNPALTAFNADFSVWKTCYDACGSDPKPWCVSPCGSKPLWEPQYEDPAYADYKTDLTAWRSCRGGVQEGFEYTPGAYVESLESDAKSSVNTDIGVSSDYGDMMTKAQSEGICIPASDAAALEGVIDPRMICP